MKEWANFYLEKRDLEDSVDRAGGMAVAQAPEPVHTDGRTLVSEASS
jgi:hypothetical protein